MYVVLIDQTGRDFYGQDNPRAVGPFLSSQDALKFAEGDVTKIVNVSPRSGVTDRIYWRDILVTPIF